MDKYILVPSDKYQRLQRLVGRKEETTSLKKGGDEDSILKEVPSKYRDNAKHILTQIEPRLYNEDGIFRKVPSIRVAQLLTDLHECHPKISTRKRNILKNLLLESTDINPNLIQNPIYFKDVCTSPTNQKNTTEESRKWICL